MKLKKAITTKYRKYPAVSMVGASKEIFVAADIVDSVFKYHGYEAVVSACTEQTYEPIPADGYHYLIHATASKHNFGDAIDFSGKDHKHNPIDPGTIEVMVAEIKDKLSIISDKYVVIFHKGHFHIQFNI